MNLAEINATTEMAVRVVRLLAKLAPQQKLEVMAVAQTLVNLQANRAIRDRQQQQQPPQEVRDE